MELACFDSAIFGDDVGVWWPGVALVLGVTFLCVIIFHLACREVWNVWMMLDRKLIKEIESDLYTWAKEEGISQKKEAGKVVGRKEKVLD